MTDLDGRSASCFAAEEQASGDEGIDHSADNGCLLGIGEREFGQRSAAARSIIFCNAWIDQTQEERPRHVAMLRRWQRSVSVLGMPDQRALHSTDSLISFERQPAVIALLKQLVQRKLQQGQRARLALRLEK